MRSFVAILALALAGCSGWRYQAGLANAPGINRPWTDDDFHHDAIGNGDESCPASGRAEDDALFHRWPRCGGSIFPVRSPAPPARARAPRPGPVADPEEDEAP